MTTEDVFEDPIMESKPHHGFNVMIKRKRRNLSQEALAEKLNALGLKLHQGDISKLEGSDVIEEKTLEKLAEVLECPVSELRDFDIDKAMNNCSVINSNNTNNDQSNSYSGIYQTITNSDSPALIQVYKDCLESEKEARIREVTGKDKEIEFLKDQLTKLLNKDLNI